MAKTPKNVKKAFAVASCIGSAIKLTGIRTIKLNALDMQADKAMQVFGAKAGRKIYWSISFDLREIWERLSKKHTTVLTEETLSVYIEMMCMMIPPKDFKEFFGVSPLRSRVEVDPETYAALAKSVLDLDHELNNLFGTHAYSIEMPKQKEEKAKRERDKAKPKALKLIKNRAKWNRRRMTA